MSTFEIRVYPACAHDHDREQYVLGEPGELVERIQAAHPGEARALAEATIEATCTDRRPRRIKGRLINQVQYLEVGLDAVAAWSTSRGAMALRAAPEGPAEVPWVEVDRETCLGHTAKLSHSIRVF